MKLLMNQLIPVSVVIVARNEENNIGEALESIKDFEDIVVVDSFSEDNTIEMCRKYTSRIYQHEWQGYAKQKQMAVDYATKEWVLILDADERVTPELKKEIIEKITPNSEPQTLPTPYCGFYIPRKNFFLGKWIRHSGWWPDHTLRLFRKDISYVEQREVHEKVVVNGPVGCLKGVLEHYTYRTVSDYIKKMERYSSLAAKEMLIKDKIPSPSLLLFKLVGNPFFTFMKMFFLKQGFRDGIHGFILAVFYSFYTFLKYAKTLEHSTLK
ncbi:MAG: glycosyltransferase family 2 protein [Thermodesulfovibrionales bacterium]|nr:glycosyltransferase family 2 protein [Thermodesulfovibrionales bacterium]